MTNAWAGLDPSSGISFGAIFPSKSMIPINETISRLNSSDKTANERLLVKM